MSVLRKVATVRNFVLGQRLVFLFFSCIFFCLMVINILCKSFFNDDFLSYRIVKILGRVFYFVVQDVQDKLNILSAHLREEPDKYRSLGTMVHFERDNGRLTRKGHPPNGSRTYLRLHRALLFIFRFIQELVNTGSHHHESGHGTGSEASNHPSLGEMTQTVYTETLSQHHAWLIRKGVSMAVHTLPSRGDFLTNLCRESGIEDREDLLNFLRDSLPVIQDAYAISQRIYAGNDLLNLD